MIAGVIENAVRHSPPESAIEVAVAADGLKIKVTVTDEGEGVQQADAERIFERHVRGARRGLGFGVGLALARWVMTRQGGAIALESPVARPGAKGPGTRVTLTFPMARPMTARRILVIEDDEDIASAVARGLAREGYAPVVAHDLAEAAAVPDLAAIDAAVVDVMLGADDGRELVRRLRAAGMDAPIVMLSALSGVEDRAAGLAAGADDYVAKPFDFADLVARIQVQEHRRAAGRQGRRFAGLSYDPELRLVAGPERSVALTEREARLLELFLLSPEKLLNRHWIYDTLWGDLGGASENVVDVYVGYLRRKLAALGDAGVALRTVRGRGFLLTRAREEAHHDA